MLLLFQYIRTLSCTAFVCMYLLTVVVAIFFVDDVTNFLCGLRNASIVRIAEDKSSKFASSLNLKKFKVGVKLICLLLHSMISYQNEYTLFIRYCDL